MPKILRYDLDCSNLGNIILFKLTTLIFLIYFSMILRSKVEVTLLVIIVKPLPSAQMKSAQMKSAIMSDLMFLSALLILATCLLDNIINFSELAELIRTKTCLLNRSFIIMLSLDFLFFSMFRTLWTSIFFAKRLLQISYSLVVILELNNISEV